MPTVVVFNPKGGSGKTTLSTNLAVALSQQGKTVTLHDLDPQLSSSDWLKTRKEHQQTITLSTNESLTGSDWEVFDTPAGWPIDKLSALATEMQYLIIPVLPSSLDIKVSVRFLMSLNKADLLNGGWKIAMVANRVKRSTISQRTLDAFLHHLQIPFVAQLGDSQNYVKAAERGMGIMDLPTHRVKREQIQWQKLLAWLHG
ncbi:MAG TPA: hypothetical protein ENJ60_05820 [Aeromonadales bacterium]|nr:hypothetical protein [Aeromonadales bacterium]